ncbi:MAG: helix-hairpin-helix domain-containing protein [Thermoplasmatota archaeon]
MILTNLHRVPGSNITEVMGIAFGYSSVEGGSGEDWVVRDNGKEWPWSETPKHYEALFKTAEERLAASGRKLGADAVVKVEGKLTRSPEGRPEMTLMGTAVKLEKDGDLPSGSPPEPSTPDDDDDDEGISVKIDGVVTKWTPPPASPSLEALKKMKGRGKKEERKPDKGSQVLMIAQELGIPTSKAMLLIDAGFGSIEELAEASIKEITAVEGINPTQARLMRQKARELLAEE